MALFASCFSLLSCSTTSGPVFKGTVLKEQQAIIYFYREFAVAGAVLSAYVAVDGKEVASLSNGGYFAYLTRPGQVKIKATGGFMERKLELKVEPGQSYYVRTGGVMSENDFILVLMQPEVGKVQIMDNHLQTLK